MKEYKVYLKEVNWYRTTVTAACEEDAKDRAKEEHEYRETFEDYEEGHATFADSSLDFLTETEMAEAAALRDQVADLKSQLAARDAELAALREENAKLKGEVKPEVEAEPEVKVESEPEVAALRAKVAKLEAERKDTMKQSLMMLCERDNTIKAHERMLELLGTRVEKTETKINYISMEAEGDEDKSDEDTETGGAA